MHDGIGEIKRLPSGVEKAPTASYVRWGGYPPPENLGLYIALCPQLSGYNYVTRQYKKSSWVLRWYIIDTHPRTNKLRIRCLGNTEKMAKAK